MDALLDLWRALRPCPACQRRAAARGGVCGPCHARWFSTTPATTTPAATDLVALGAYRGDLGRLVRAAKYRPDRPLLRALGTVLGRRVRALACDAGRASGLGATWAVVPVPGDVRRERRRGQDHAMVLAAAVAAALGDRGDLRPGLRRVRGTRPQAGLSDAERRVNVDGAIVWRDRRALRATPVVLVDDVLTTGATARACRAALEAAGAVRVVVAVVARAR